MDIKKYDRYKLEKKRVLFFQIGFILSLLILILAFELITVEEKKEEKKDIVELDIEFQAVEIVRYEDIKTTESALPSYNTLNIIEENSVKESANNKNIGLKTKNNFKIIEYDEEVVSTNDIKKFNRKPLFKPELCKTQQESENEILKFIKETIHYPAYARENNLQAKVYIKFMIDKNGNLKSPIIINKTEKILEDEAIRIVKKLNNWQAGIENGQAVDMWYTIPIIFQLE